MIRSWLRDSGAVLGFLGLVLLVAPFTFGVGGVLVAVSIALLATWGLFSLVVSMHNAIAGRTRAHRHI